MKTLLVVFTVLALLGGSLAGAVEGEPQADGEVTSIDCAKDVRPAVLVIFEQGEANGLSLLQMIKQAIEIGPNLCGVLVVAAERGYDPQWVLEALLEAGISADVIARAAIDAGYDRELVAMVLFRTDPEGLGFTPQVSNGAAVLRPPSSIAGGSRGGSVSPSTF
jgi:hypothetical protein